MGEFARSTLVGNW
jgi:hypothetical protein